MFCLLTMLMLIWAQEPVNALEEAGALYFTTYTTEQGLSQNSAMAIIQDRTGFLWIGTEDGLNRFDGYSFDIYRESMGDDRKLSSNVIHDLLEDRRGNLWIATDGGGVNRFDPVTGQFTWYRYNPDDPRSLPDNRTRALIEDAEGIIWIATMDGLAALNPETGACRRYYTEIGNPNTLPGNKIQHLALDKRGHLWIAGNGGTSELDPGEGKLVTHDPRSARYILIEDDDTIWIGHEEGLIRLETTGRKTSYRTGPEEEGGLSHPTVRSIFRDSRGWLWLGTMSGLTIYPGSMNRSVHYDVNAPGNRRLPFNNIRTFIEDRGGEIWIGGHGGMTKCRPGHIPFEITNRKKNGLSNDRVRAVLRDSRNILWVGTADGLNYFEPDMTTPRRNLLKDKEEETGINGHIWSLMEDSRGDIWIGTARGPAIWQRETGRFMSRRNSMPPEMDPSETYIRAMTEDVGGHIWLGAPGGLVRLDKDGGSRFFNGGPGEVLPHPFIGVLLKGRGDRLWIGSMGGSLAAVATDDIEAGFTVWSADKGPDGPVHPKISSLHQQADGTLWVGTYGGGLSRFDINTGRFRHFTLRDGMPNLVIYGILEDMRGDLWLSSNAGITRFDTETGPVRTYNHADGLPSNEFNMGASFADESGLLFFGSVAGMVSFLPGRFLQNEYRPPLVLAGLRKNTQVFLTETPIWRTETLDLGPEDRSFTVDYAALNFIQPSKNRYAVKLEGFDTDFQYVGGQRSATYTNLDPGRYVFHLKAANNDGYWSDPKELLQVTVPSPWFRSGTAYVLYAALFLLAAFYVALTQRSLAINNRELERRIADRTIELDLRNAELAEKNSELAHAYEELKMASLSDPLTGLGNRRFLFQSIEKEISALNRLYRKAGENLVTPPSDAFLGIFMISLDFFMELSDRHSYQNDDQILIQFSRLLEKVCRDSDWLVRWGGAEFLILTRRTEVAGLAKMAERLHEEIGNHTFQLADGDEMILHCSVGFTCYPFSAVVPRALSWEPTLQIADLAMHAARQSGSDTWIGLYAADGDPGDWVEQLFSDPYPLIAEKQVILETSLPEISELIWPKPAVIK